MNLIRGEIDQTESALRNDDCFKVGIGEKPYGIDVKDYRSQRKTGLFPLKSC